MKLGIYRHYKGKNYKVIGLCHHSETLEEMVLYEALYENDIGQLWVRPKKMFEEKVDFQGKTVDRFEYIGFQKGNERL